MSQRELAGAAHVPQSTIARIESGARQPSLPLLVQILAAVDLEPRITLETYDAHDDVLDAEDARLTQVQRAARRKTLDQFVAHVTAPTKVVETGHTHVGCSHRAGRSRCVSSL